MASISKRLLGGLAVLVAAVVGVQLVNGDLADTEVASSGGAERALVGSSTVTTTTTTTTTSTTLPPRRAVLGFTGDLLPHAPVVRAAAANATAEGHDFAPMFDLVRPRLASYDLAICHLETPLSLDERGASGYPVFNAPRSLADAIKTAGYDGCSTASNHSFDRRGDGVRATLDVLDATGVGHAGMARDRAEAEMPTLYEAGGITVGHLSYTYGLNGFTLPSDEPYLVNLIDADEMLAAAAATRAAGAELVVMSIHWGAEYQRRPTADQVALAEQLLPSADIDLIIGHHAHVVQPITKIGDEWVVYGLGNFLSNQSANCCTAATQDGVIVEVTVADGPTGVAVESVSAVPTWVDRSDYTIVAVDDALAESTGDASVLEASRQRTREAVGLLGP